jgi:N utilization substance protein B
MASRRKARESALQMLFQWDISKESPEKVEELFWSGQQINKEQGHTSPWNRRRLSEQEMAAATAEDPILRSLAGELFRGTASRVEEIDTVIRRHAEHWRMERMAVVDRNVLRLAVYEFTERRETPPVVVINEALEIARKFSDEESVAFINGLLDTIRKELPTISPDEPLGRVANGSTGT